MMHWKPTTTRASTERGGPDPGSDLVEVGRATEIQQRSRQVADVDFPFGNATLETCLGVDTGVLTSARSCTVALAAFFCTEAMPFWRCPSSRTLACRDDLPVTGLKPEPELAVLQ